MLHCAHCGRFVGEDAVELQNLAQANPSDPDGWTDTYVCTPGKGCRTDEDEVTWLEDWKYLLSLCDETVT